MFSHSSVSRWVSVSAARCDVALNGSVRGGGTRSARERAIGRTAQRDARRRKGEARGTKNEAQRTHSGDAASGNEAVPPLPPCPPPPHCMRAFFLTRRNAGPRECRELGAGWRGRDGALVVFRCRSRQRNTTSARHRAHFGCARTRGGVRGR